MTNLQQPANDSIQPLHTKSQQAFLTRNRQNSTPISFDWTRLQYWGNDRTAPLGVKFVWETSSTESILEISEYDDFSNALTIKTHQQWITLQNFKISQKYFWRVNDSEVFSFITEDVAPRWLYVDGLTNIRDQGGWKTKEGFRIRQGLIFRGSEMEWHSYHDRDPTQEPHLKISPNGIETMLYQLNIKSDLDLRISAYENLKVSPLGKDVNLKLIPVSPYAEFLVDTQKPKVKEIFELLANKEAYPIYYHCWGGADRTGTIAFLLESYLGVPEQSIIDDYEISSLACFGARSRDSDYFASFENELRKCDPSGNLQSRSEQFLLSCGISQHTLQTLKDNLLEKVN